MNLLTLANEVDLSKSRIVDTNTNVVTRGRTVVQMTMWCDTLAKEIGDSKITVKMVREALEECDIIDINDGSPRFTPSTTFNRDHFGLLTIDNGTLMITATRSDEFNMIVKQDVVDKVMQIKDDKIEYDRAIAAINRQAVTRRNRRSERV